MTRFEQVLREGPHECVLPQARPQGYCLWRCQGLGKGIVAGQCIWYDALGFRFLHRKSFLAAKMVSASRRPFFLTAQLTRLVPISKRKSPSPNLVTTGHDCDNCVRAGPASVRSGEAPGMVLTTPVGGALFDLAQSYARRFQMSIWNMPHKGHKSLEDLLEL